MAKRKENIENENIEVENKSDNLVKITKNCLSVYRKESELEGYIKAGWKVTE